MLGLQLYPGEKIEDLQRGNIKIIRGEKGFTYGTDSILLAYFANVKKNSKVCDLGAGNGILSMLLYARESSILVDAVEIDALQADRIKRSAMLNNIQDKIKTYNADFRKISEVLQPASYDMVISNPPYYEMRGDSARTQITANFKDLAKSAGFLLKNRGRLVTMCPAMSMFKMSNVMQEEKFSISRLRFVVSKAGKKPYLALIEGRFNTNSECIIEPTLTVLDEGGNYTTEAQHIYFG